LKDKPRDDDLGRECRTGGEKRKAYRIFVGKPDGKSY
jgi:hypothetical protein